jgi:hypothetical protein
MFVRFQSALLRFRFHQIVLGDRFYLPLPKMTPRQMRLIRERLESIGFRTALKNTLRATKAGVTIVVDPSGLCWSNEALSDAIAPVVPEMLRCDKKTVSHRALRGLYFASERHGQELHLRLSPRMEFDSLWDELRATGACALTPDEKRVYSALLSRSPTDTPLLTDFPVQGCVVRRIGRREYYDSKLEPSEAASSLRVLGSKGERNSYLPRDSLLALQSTALREETMGGFLDDLSEWCFMSAR